MNLFGIDYGYKHTGIAVYTDSKLFKTYLHQSNKDKSIQDNLYALSVFIKKLLKQYSPKYVYLEKSIPIPGRYNEPLHLYAYGVLLLILQKYNTHLVPVSTWKKHWGIRAKDGHKYSVTLVKQKYNIDISSHEADAICIAEYGRDTLN